MNRPPSSPGAKNVLVVDDEKAIARLIQTQLNRAGHRATAVHDGMAALEALREHDFDLVILDFVMPRMDGLEVLREMKNDPRLESIPVAMLTTQATTLEERLALDPVPDKILAKPFDNKEILALLV